MNWRLRFAWAGCEIAVRSGAADVGFAIRTKLGFLRARDTTARPPWFGATNRCRDALVATANHAIARAVCGRRCGTGRCFTLRGSATAAGIKTDIKTLWRKGFETYLFDALTILGRY